MYSCHNTHHEDIRGVHVYQLSFLTLVIDSGQLHILPALCEGKSCLYFLNIWQGGPQSRSGHFGEEKYLLALLGIPLSSPQYRHCTDCAILGPF